MPHITCNDRNKGSHDHDDVIETIAHKTVHCFYERNKQRINKNNGGIITMDILLHECNLNNMVQGVNSSIYSPLNGVTYTCIKYFHTIISNVLLGVILVTNKSNHQLNINDVDSIGDEIDKHSSICAKLISCDIIIWNGKNLLYANISADLPYKKTQVK